MEGHVGFFLEISTGIVGWERLEELHQGVGPLPYQGDPEED